MIEHYQVKDGLVSDTKNNLMWMRCSLGQEWKEGTCQGEARIYRWAEAMKVANNSNYSGYDDWRLPTRDELYTLVYCYSKDIHTWINTGRPCDSVNSLPVLPSVFPETPDRWFWHSMVYPPYYAAESWAVSLTANDSPHDSYIVRLVRNGY